MSRSEVKRIARERVEILFRRAEEVIREDARLAQRYVEIARRVAMKARIRLPRKWRRRLCKHCKVFLTPGVNCRVRLRQNRYPHITVYCFNCRRFTRYPYKVKRKAKEGESRGKPRSDKRKILQKRRES